MAANLANLTPVEVDVLYLERLTKFDAAARNLDYAAKGLLYRHAKRVYTYGHTWHLHPDSRLDQHDSPETLWSETISAADLVELLRQRGGWESDAADYEAAVERLDEARLACDECEQEYRSRPWSRYWLVTSSDGHIHSRRGCSTCNKGREPTGFALAAYLSGKPVEDAVADLGPALCSVCFPAAPVESKEQARISARLALALREEGCEAFKQARDKAAAKASEKAATRCPGSGQRAVSSDRHWQACPCCGEVSRKTSTGKVRPHAKPLYYVENGDYKCWTGSGWGPSSKKAIFESKAEAAAVAAGTPGATVRRK